MKPKRIIVMWLDGISAMFVKSFNNNSSMSMSYLDKLYKQAHIKKYCYGFDGTVYALYAIMSGQTHIETNVSRVSNAKHLQIREWLTDKIKEKGYKTHYFTNYKYCLDKFAIKFDSIKHEKMQYDLSKTNINDNFWGKNTNDKTLIWIQDFFTHDREGKPFNFAITTKQYEDLIKRNIILLEKNLKFLKFNQKEDLLLIMSDHGLTLDSKVVPEKMTVAAHLKVMFKKERLGNWDIAGKEIKSRVLFMMLGCGIKHEVDECVCTIQKAFNYLSKTIGINNYMSPSAECYNHGSQAIILNCGMFPILPWRLLQKVIFNDRHYQFVYIWGEGKQRQKIIYQPNLSKGHIFDLGNDIMEKNPMTINYKNLPYVFKLYIKEYNRTRRRDFEFIKEKLKKGTISPL